MQALSQQNPVLMIFEDAHWADPSSLELLGRLVDRISSFRVLLLMTFRPEFQSSWIGRSHVTTLTINRLTRQEAKALIDRVVGNNFIGTFNGILAFAADLRARGLGHVVNTSSLSGGLAVGQPGCAAFAASN